MAQFIKKIVRKQSRSTSPNKKRIYESIPWTNSCSTAESSFGILPSTTCPNDHNYNICRFCHTALHHECPQNFSRQIPLAPTISHIPAPETEEPEVDFEPRNSHSFHDHSRYQPPLFNNYHFKKNDFQFWNPQENVSETHEFASTQPFPSSSEQIPQGKPKKKNESRKKQENLDVSDGRFNTAVETMPVSVSNSKHFHDIPVLVDDSSTRHRSYSPKKSPVLSSTKSQRKSRSKSPAKKSRQANAVFSYLSPQCQNEGCSATIFVEDTKFLVCKQQLSHVSEYFRSLFMANRSIPISGAMQNSLNEFSIVVSSFKHPPPATQFKWFLESVIQAPILRDVTDDTLETLMRLSKRFRAQGVEMRCARYIRENVNKKSPLVALCWLNWVLKHKFDKATHDACLPRVASSSLSSLEEHRTMITEKLLADLFAAKIRTLYAQTANVFQTIHSMGHFYVDVDRCPKCGRQKEQGRVRLYVSPCKRAVGCERCFKEKECDVVGKASSSYQAFYQCPHGLIPLNDSTADCSCQVSLLATQLSNLFVDQETLKRDENSY